MAEQRMKGFWIVCIRRTISRMQEQLFQLLFRKRWAVSCLFLEP